VKPASRGKEWGSYIQVLPGHRREGGGGGGNRKTWHEAGFRRKLRIQFSLRKNPQFKLSGFEWQSQSHPFQACGILQACPLFVPVRRRGHFSMGTSFPWINSKPRLSLGLLHTKRMELNGQALLNACPITYGRPCWVLAQRSILSFNDCTNSITVCLTR
jgi:hypothetical protein